MINKSELLKRLESENLKVNIIDFDIIGEEVWFAFSFDEEHTERMYAVGLDPNTEDDALIGYGESDEEDYLEAISCIRCSRLNPNRAKS